jgi:ribulose-phosphate 3-epimerase
MAVIAPTVTAYEPHEYREQIERLASFAKRIHIDLMDGVFAPTKSPGVEQAWWPDSIEADIHLMYQKPMDEIDHLIKIKPSLVVVHFEAELDHAVFTARLHEAGIRVGLALLQDTSVETAFEALALYDHAQVYSGNLGRHGGHADLNLLDKVREIREKFPQIEISWDGGINDQNAKVLVEAGVQVLNTGGFISKAPDPAEAYNLITKEVS